MSELNEATPFDEIGSEYLACVDIFDKTKSHFYDWLAGLETELPPVDAVKIESAEYMDDMASAFVETVMECRRSETDYESAKKDIAMLWKEDDSDRVELFVTVTDEHVFSAITAEDMDVVVDSIFSDSENETELADNFREMYRCYLSSDVATYLGFIEAMHEKSMEPNLTADPEIPDVKVLLDIDLIRASSRMIKIGAVLLGISVGAQLLDKYKRMRPW